ncbi:MAG: hypothetical protein RL095_810 [Verrucomicrobiota bacterium]|jgi:hypothetical protein
MASPFDIVSSSPEPFKGKSLFVATPMYGGQCFYGYMRGVMEVQRICIREKIGFQMEAILGSSIITSARNSLVEKFLESKATHLLFLDADIGFQAHDVFQLLAFDKDIIGATYPKKLMDWHAIHRAAHEGGISRKDAAKLRFAAAPIAWRPLKGKSFNIGGKDPVAVETLPTGFMMIKREVILKFLEVFPDRYMKNGKKKTPLIFDFHFDQATHEYWGEDYHFCREWIAMGGTILCCPWMKLGHTGTYEFQGDLIETLMSDSSIQKTPNPALDKA